MDSSTDTKSGSKNEASAPPKEVEDVIAAEASAPPKHLEEGTVPHPEATASVLSFFTYWWINPLIFLGFQRPLQVDDVWQLREFDDVQYLYPRFAKAWADAVARDAVKPSLLKALFASLGKRFFLAIIPKLFNDASNFVGPLLISTLVAFTQDASMPAWQGFLYALGFLGATTVTTFSINAYFHLVYRVSLHVRSVLVAAIFRKCIRLSTDARRARTSGEILNLMSIDTEKVAGVVPFTHLVWSSPMQIIVALILLYQQLGPAMFGGVAVMLLIIPLQAIFARMLGSRRKAQMMIMDQRVKLTNEILQGIKIIKMYAWEKPYQDLVEIRRKDELDKLRAQAYVRVWQQMFTSASSVMVALVSFGVFALTTHEPMAPGQAFTSLALFQLLSFALFVFPMMIGHWTQGWISIKRLRDFFVLGEIDHTPTDCQCRGPKGTLVIENGTFAWESDPSQTRSKDQVLGALSPEADADHAIVGAGEGKQDLTPTPESAPAAQHTSTSAECASKADISESTPTPSTTKTPTEPQPTPGPMIDGPVPEPGSEPVAESNEFLLHQINLHVAPGQLAMVLGSVGCGKSALLEAVLGEMHTRKGSVLLSGTVAYTGQQVSAWIMNATVRENITFGAPFDQIRYDQVLDACALQQDLKQLPAGDRTEIGEKGINLSGGQKQRVSLARAVYADADIYILDDPLSAVDSQTQRILMEKCILGPILQGKTRLLSINALQYAHSADLIVVLAHGRVVEQGPYQQLVDADGMFQRLLKDHVHGTSSSSSSDSESDDESGSNSGCESVSEGEVRMNSDAEGSHETGRIEVPSSVQPAPQNFGERATDAKDSASGETETIETTQGETHRAGADADDGCGDCVIGPKGEKNEEACCLQRRSHSGRHRKHSHGRRRKSTAGSEKGKPKKGDALTKGQKKDGQLVEKEERLTGAMKLAVAATYIKSMGGLVFLACIVFFFLVSQGTIVGADYWLSYWTQQGQDDPSATAALLWLYLGVYASFSVGAALMATLRGTVWAVANYIASKSLHSRLLASVLRAPMSFFETTPTGRIINRFSKDCDVVDAQLPMNLFSLMRCLTIVLFVLGVISTITPWFLLPLLPILFLYFKVSAYYRPTNRELQRIESVQRSPIYNHFSETLGGVVSIRAFARSHQFIQTNAQRLNLLQKIVFSRNASNRWLDLRLQFTGTMIVSMAALLTVSARATGLQASLVGLSLSLALQVTGNLTWAVRMTAAAEADLNAVERLRHYIDTPPEAAAITEPRPPQDWPQNGVITFKNASLQYRPELPCAMRNVTFSLRAGERVGVVGRTGSGKSTLMVAMLRLVELCEGSIEIDGMDAASVGLEDIRSRITIIPQDPVLYSGTVRRNLDPFERYTDGELWKSLERVHLKEAVEVMALAEQESEQRKEDAEAKNGKNGEGKDKKRRNGNTRGEFNGVTTTSNNNGKNGNDSGQNAANPADVAVTVKTPRSGLDALVTEFGENLSVGQRQLLCMARALLRRSKIIMLDEATAAVDYDTDQLVQHTIRQEFSDATVMTIAHRLNTIIDCDRVLVMEAGRMVELDTPAVLVSNPDSVFAHMVDETGTAAARLRTRALEASGNGSKTANHNENPNHTKAAESTS